MSIYSKIAAAALLGSVSTLSQAIIIDAFTVDQAAAHSFGAAAPASGFSVVSGSGIIGGERELLSVKTAGTNFGQVFAAAGDSNGTQLSHSQSSGTRGYSLVIWDGADGAAGIDYGLNTSFAGQDGIDFLLTNSDSLGLGLSIRLFALTSATQYSEIEIPIDAGLGSEKVLFNDFIVGTGLGLQNGSNAMFLPTNAANSGADFANINAIALLIDGSDTPDADASLSLLETFVAPAAQPIPLPGTLLIMFTGLAGLRLRKLVS